MEPKKNKILLKTHNSINNLNDEILKLLKNNSIHTSNTEIKKTNIKKRKIPKKKLKSLEVITTKKNYIINYNSIPGINNQIQKENQDNFFIEQHYIKNNSFLLGVIDGHGINGKAISSFIKLNFPKILKKNLKSIFTKDEIIIAIKKSFIETNKYLLNQVDCYLSGSTLSIILIIDDLIYSANVGDSEIHMIKEVDKKNKFYQITKNHLPSSELEKKRILESGGEINKILDSNNEKVGPERIWIPKLKLPGLMMTRCLGDSLARHIGLIASPYISISKFNPNIKSIILGTDGLWDYFNKNDLIKNFEKFKYTENLSYELCKISKNNWLLNNKDYNDDITCVSIIFN